MKKSWIIAVGFSIGLAALVYLGRHRHEETLSVSDRMAQREQGGSSVDSGGGQNRSGGDVRGGSAGQRPRPGASTDSGGRERGGGNRDQSWPPRRRDGSIDMAARSGGDSGRVAERGARTADAPLSRPELPSGSGGRDGREPGDGSDAVEDEPIPDVAYDGSDKVFDTTKKVEIADAALPTAGGSVAFWVEPQWEENSEDGATFVQLGDNGLRLVKKGNTLSFEYTDASGAVQGGSADISEWQAGDWRHVAAIWKDGSLALYVDGAQLFLNHPANPPTAAAGAVLSFGSDPASGGGVALAQVSGPKIWNRDLSPDEVRQLFESGGQPVQ